MSETSTPTWEILPVLSSEVTFYSLFRSFLSWSHAELGEHLDLLHFGNVALWNLFLSSEFPDLSSLSLFIPPLLPSNLMKISRLLSSPFWTTPGLTSTSDNTSHFSSSPSSTLNSLFLSLNLLLQNIHLISLMKEVLSGKIIYSSQL